MIRNFIKNNPFLYATALRLKHRRASARTKKNFLSYVAANSTPRLQLGAGVNLLTGWFNTDYFERSNVHFLDVTKTFPFPADIFEFVFSEHHIEHITYRDAQTMLRESYRVMRPGGYIKIATPDLKKYAQAYVGGDLKDPVIATHVKEWIYGGFAYAANYIPINGDYEAHFINDIFMNYEHRFIYDVASLTAILQKAGFKIVAPQLLNVTEFHDIDNHTDEFNRAFTLTVYAQKPASE